MTLLSLLGLLVISGSAAAATPSATKILITGFEPFGGRSKNLSFEIARTLALEPGLIAEGVSVSVCVLPVDYDRGAEVARRCFESLGEKPALVLSLGEGDCSMRLETAASNLDDTSMPDNSGVLRRNRVIDPALPARVGMSLAVDRMYCVRPPSLAPIRASVSPGFYVCNNTAFHLAHFFNARAIPYGFIHVPPADCGTMSNVRNNARALGVLLSGALAHGSAGVPAGYPLPHPTRPRHLWPTDIASSRALRARAEAAPAPACSLELLGALTERYESGDLEKIEYLPGTGG
jgi:pyroglutamyl-peptidase